jgi:hypothetical protein
MSGSLQLKREAFEFLYIHANCLAELALDQLALDFERTLSTDAPGPEPLTEAQREEQALALLGQMDMLAVADGWKGGPEFEAQVLRGIEELKEAGAAPLSDAGSDSHEGAVNLDLYLQRAYAVPEQIRARIDGGMARLDMASLDRLLDALPAGLAPLTHVLNAGQLAQWLACYQGGNVALDEIVTLMRGVDAVP